MSLFKDMLKSDETLFKDSIALDFDYIPKLLPHRSEAQFQIASCFKPLFSNRNGRNAIIVGSPGIGKTVASKHVLRELEEETDDIYPIFISCWEKSSTFKIFVEICHQLGYRLTHNKRTDELFEEIKRITNKKTVVFIFDEVDKADDSDFLYMLLEDIYKKSIILITNFKDWVVDLDERVKSRLMPELIEFKPYTYEETKSILVERVKYAFFENVFNDEIISEIAKKTHETNDIRTGLFLLRETANFAEERAKKKVDLEDLKKAIAKIIDIKKKNSDKLEDDLKLILELIKNNNNKKIGELFDLYKTENPDIVYKTFQRKIRKLNENGFISSKSVTGGKGGTTTIVSYESTKKLTEF